MKTVYRYNSKRREDRAYNTTGKEKNPNAVRFYARSLEFAEPYRVIYNKEGFELYEAELETTEVDINSLFDMEANFRSLSTYNAYIENNREQQLKDYTSHLENWKHSERPNGKKITQKERQRNIELFEGFIAECKSEDFHKGFDSGLMHSQFQSLSDFEYQDQLIAELRGLGYEGYFTTKEVAIFRPDEEVERIKEETLNNTYEVTFHWGYKAPYTKTIVRDLIDEIIEEAKDRFAYKVDVLNIVSKETQTTQFHEPSTLIYA